MALTINASNTTTDANRAAKALIEAARGIVDSTERIRNQAKPYLWGFKEQTRALVSNTTIRRLAPPDVILAEIAEADQVKLMLGDVAARLLLSLKSDNPVAAFVASSPVPDTDLVVFKDVDGSPVDLTPEIVALLTKMGTVKSVEVATVAL